MRRVSRYNEINKYIVKTNFFYEKSFSFLQEVSFNENILLKCEKYLVTTRKVSRMNKINRHIVIRNFSCYWYWSVYFWRGISQLPYKSPHFASKSALTNQWDHLCHNKSSSWCLFTLTFHLMNLLDLLRKISIWWTVIDLQSYPNRK